MCDSTKHPYLPTEDHTTFQGEGDHNECVIPQTSVPPHRRSYEIPRGGDHNECVIPQNIHTSPQKIIQFIEDPSVKLNNILEGVCVCVCVCGGGGGGGPIPI